MNDFDIEVPDIPMPEQPVDKTLNDECQGAVKFAFIGAGQGGGRLAKKFWDLGYRRVGAVNTAEQDLATLGLPEDRLLCLGSGGAGKQPEVAARLFSERKEDVLDFMHRSFGPTFDRIIVTVGAGGGTGAGCAVPLVKAARELQIASKCPTDKVGVMVALPKYSEGKKVNANAYAVLSDLCALVEQGVVSPLIILDNEKISTLYPGLAVDPFWDTANTSVCSLLHLFNNVCTRPSTYAAFDTADFKTVLDGGLIVLGATPVKNPGEATGISSAMRDNLKRNILSGGVDLSTGTMAAAVVIGGQAVLAQTPQEYLDRAFEQLNRLLKPGSVVHRGIYRGNKDSLVVYTAIGGLSRPLDKLAELRKLGDVIAPGNGRPVQGL